MTAQGRSASGNRRTLADYGETIQVAVVVEDAESTPAQLVYQWRACGGTFTGTGPLVEWNAPAGGTLPSTCTIEVTVLDDQYVLTRSVVVRLHNSVVEVGALALEFLEEFANSTIPAATTVRNFSRVVPGQGGTSCTTSQKIATPASSTRIFTERDNDSGVRWHVPQTRPPMPV